MSGDGIIGSVDKMESELPLLPVLCRKDAVAVNIGAEEGFSHITFCLKIREQDGKPSPRLLIPYV
jgi:hypothetical protein